MSKKDRMSQRREKILNLLLKGLKQKEIYTLMKISKRTCINDVNFLKRYKSLIKKKSDLLELVK